MGVRRGREVGLGKVQKLKTESQEEGPQVKLEVKVVAGGRCCRLIPPTLCSQDKAFLALWGQVCVNTTVL